MVKLINASKMLAAGALVSIAALLSVSTASADTTTNTNFVPNTIACDSTAKSETANGGAFSAKWNNDNTFTITVTQAPNKDIQLFASSYHLINPKYNGGCFSRNANLGTFDQTYDGNTQTIVIPAGSISPITVTLAMPATCYNEQADLYFGQTDSYTGKTTALNGTVTSSGHDNYGFITGNIMLTSKNPSCAPGKGAGPSTPSTPSTPVATPVATVSAPTLTNTGLNVRLTSILAAGLIAAAAFVFTRRAKISE